MFVAAPDDTRWVGMWWGGFLVCGILLVFVAVPFFAFPKTLLREKEKIRLMEKSKPDGDLKKSKPQSESESKTYGKDVKGRSGVLWQFVFDLFSPSLAVSLGLSFSDIPVSMWRLVSNPVYVITCLGACMELIIVSGFVVFLPKYLETQFSLGKSQASVFTGQ